LSCYFLESTAFAKLFVQEQGTDALIRLMEAVEDNRKLISASTPLEVYAAVRRRERAGDISAEDATAALDILRLEAARMVQEPLNPAVLEAARQIHCNSPPPSSLATCSKAPRLSLFPPHRTF
jgi:predicted nucleic acid-binding protein